jgi:hypothetical protein
MPNLMQVDAREITTDQHGPGILEFMVSHNSRYIFLYHKNPDEVLVKATSDKMQALDIWHHPGVYFG